MIFVGKSEVINKDSDYFYVRLNCFPYLFIFINTDTIFFKKVSKFNYNK